MNRGMISPAAVGHGDADGDLASVHFESTG
jgi:hypothetical protein